MRKYFSAVFVLIISGIFFSCTEKKGTDLLSVDERVNEAKANLMNDLLAPANGWRLEYQPTPTSGVFLMLLKFKDNGEVTIQSDVAVNSGEFYNHTIPFRIDNALGLELILETYGVFHHLFELKAASFGAEFEFIFVNNDAGNLVFKSASDVSSVPTTLTFVPAGDNDSADFAREISENLNAFQTNIPLVFEDNPSPLQQIIFTNDNISLFWELNPTERTIFISFAGKGVTIDEIISSGVGVTINQSTGYTLANGGLTLLDPINFGLAGKAYSFNKIEFTDFELNGGANYCTLSPANGPKYNGQIAGIGAISMLGSLFDIDGTAFQPIAEFPYSVNIPFLFDGDGKSLVDEGGIIAEKFPNASAFVFYYGYQAVDQPAYAAGFILENDDGSSDIFVREFDVTTTQGNKVALNFTNNFSHSGTAGIDDEANLTEITDLIFAGTDLYAFDFPAEGIQIFKLYNPCNGYEVFLVGN